MKRTFNPGLMMAVSLLSAASAFAAESAGDAARRCGQILGERERLACFDRAFPAGPETAALAESRAAAPVAPAPVVAPVAPVARAATPAVVAPVAVAATAAVVAAPTVATPTVATPALGDEQLRKNDKAAGEKSEESVSLTARVTAVKEVREDTWRMNLENGQVWQQMDMSSTFVPEVGDTVQIQRKMMGGYNMTLTGDKKSPWIRVSRLQ